MKIFITLLCVLALCGCQRDNESARMDAMDKKLDAVLQNQENLKIQLDKLPNLVSKIGFFYHTNETSVMFSYQTNTLANMLVQESDIENAVNSEIRRVAQIQIDAGRSGVDKEEASHAAIQHSIDEIKFTLEDSTDPKMTRLQNDLVDIRYNLDQIKTKLGIF